MPYETRKTICSRNLIYYFLRQDEDGGFFIEGCYKGRQGSLGRGDIECVASLDFALSKPPDTAHPQIQENWRRLKALDTHVLVMEENYFSKTAYLVDTTKLGNGKHGDTAATVVKFGIPIYPSHLEGLAFVPDLSDDIHLGTVFLGSQRGDVVACKLPLGDLVSDKNVTCTGHPTLFRHSIDSMEFDPTFQVMPGKFGALVIGSDPVGKAVYVDPWRLQNGEVLTWSEEFRLRSEAVDGHPMYGREGHAIHGNRSFYALDDNRHNNRGVVVCDISNKPVSTAQNVTGWHASDPGSSSALQLESEPQPEKDNSRLQIVDETQQNTGITAMSGNGNTPAALLAPFDLSRLDESGMISR